ASIDDIRELMAVEVPIAHSGKYLSLLFVHVITAMETYLSDKFIQAVLDDDTALKRFVETTPEFRSEKIPVAEVLECAANIKAKVRTHLADVVWHNLPRVKPMYRDTLSVDLPSIGEIMK